MTGISHADHRARLLEERDRLREQLRHLGDEGGTGFDENFADSSQVTAERGELEALSGSLTDALEEIETAIAKLDEDRYGVCDRCGLSISEARLEAMPAAKLCITCASARH